MHRGRTRIFPEFRASEISASFRLAWSKAVRLNPVVNTNSRFKKSSKYCLLWLVSVAHLAYFIAFFSGGGRGWNVCSSSINEVQAGQSRFERLVLKGRFLADIQIRCSTSPSNAKNDSPLFWSAWKNLPSFRFKSNDFVLSSRAFNLPSHLVTVPSTTAQFSGFTLQCYIFWTVDHQRVLMHC